MRTSPWLRAFYERAKRQKGANKAKVAVARKLCELVWYEGREPGVARLDVSSVRDE